MTSTKQRRRVPLAEVAKAWGRQHVVRHLSRKPLPPQAMHMLATSLCNARCIMCGIWKAGSEKGRDLTLEQWDAVFADRLFSRLEFAGISGGEPFLRADLPDLLMLLHKHAPWLKRLSITSSGTLPDRMASAFERLVPYCREHDILLDLSISMHGIGEMFEKISGVPGGFEKVVRTFEMLQARRAAGELSMSINAVLLRENLDHAHELAAWARERNIPISFVVGEQRARFHNKGMAEVFVPDADRGKLLAFLKEMGRDLSLRKLHALRYRDLVRMMEKGSRRSLPCYYALGGFVLGHDAQLYYCSHSRPIGNCLDRSAFEVYYDPANFEYWNRELLGRECAVCPPYTLTRWEIEVHAHKVLGELALERMRSART